MSIRELAEAADVTVPGLYYHFDVEGRPHPRGVPLPGPPGSRATRPPPSWALPTAGPVQSLIVEQARDEFGRLVADREFLRLMQREAVLGDPDALAVGATLAAEWRERWFETLQAGDRQDAAGDLDLHAAADCIATFLWGLFVEYLNHTDRAVQHRIDDFARLLAPALTASM